jgi:hypothetical protein
MLIIRAKYGDRIMENPKILNALNGLIICITIVSLTCFLFPLQVQASSSTDTKETSAQLSPGTDSGWWGNVQEDIKRSEYHVTWQDHISIPGFESGYQAHRANNLRTYFTDEGIRIVPRTGDKPEWEWGLSLK